MGGPRGYHSKSLFARGARLAKKTLDPIPSRHLHEREGFLEGRLLFREKRELFPLAVELTRMSRKDNAIKLQNAGDPFSAVMDAGERLGILKP